MHEYVQNIYPKLTFNVNRRSPIGHEHMLGGGHEIGGSQS
jgi:hypothetical protein